MSPELAAALERVKGYVMSPEEAFEQRVSFVFGQQDYDSPNPRSKDDIRLMLTGVYGRPTAVNSQLAGLDAAVAQLPKGWWWSGGVCGLTCHASIGPDFQGASPEMLAAFDDGFHADIAQPSTLAAAIMDCIAQAEEAIRALVSTPELGDVR